ncbi:MAG: hypothetical protein MJE77_15245, partial [Proteobacteria bacterium]|nr:hypothetical protein [Pseudomonadota bacterium]
HFPLSSSLLGAHPFQGPLYPPVLSRARIPKFGCDPVRPRIDAVNAWVSSSGAFCFHQHHVLSQSQACHGETHYTLRPVPAQTDRVLPW